MISQSGKNKKTGYQLLKEWKKQKDSICLKSVSIRIKTEVLENEKKHLKQGLKKKGITVQEKGFPLVLETKDIDFPRISSPYKKQIENQGYRIKIDTDSISINAQSPQGIFYGIQTLCQLIDPKGNISTGEITDFPDIALRMIMIDPARQNENMEYYKRMIRFCAEYKINAILIHLTDDQTSCLYHEDYPALMHEHAWKPEQIRDLVRFAKTYHIELIPEIESFGHSRMFVRDPRFREILHKTRGERNQSWYGTDIPGYTNVLCPASKQAYEYLDKMYTRVAETFDSPWIHIGCDEVDMTSCERCEEKFPGSSPSEWFLGHVLKCQKLAMKHGRKTGIWGDMLLSHPEIAEGLSPENTIIFDWNYLPDVSGESVQFFKYKGFEVIGCPSLVCAPHMILPNEHNYKNIRRFTEIARKNKLMGINTTIWVPERYMSDVLWGGVAYSSAQSWSGSIWNDNAFYTMFFEEFFGSSEGFAFQKVWKELCGIIWHLKDFNTSCYIDEETFTEALELAKKREQEIRKNLGLLENINKDLKKMASGIQKNREAWDAIERSAKILRYVLEHVIASRSLKKNGEWNRELIRELDQKCVEAIGWIEEDWDRNRFPEDPNKNGIYVANQHLLYRFKQMHEFHEGILRD